MSAEIRIYVTGNTAVLTTDTPIICENTGTLIYTSFDADQSWQELKTATITYWYHGEKVTLTKLIAFDYFDLEKLPNVDDEYLSINFRDNAGHQTNDVRIPCLHSIIDTISTEVEPHEDVYNSIMQQLHDMGVER